MQLDKRRFSATLYINDERVASSVEPRPGCAIRTVLNQVQLMHGPPAGGLAITIDGW
jgi:hypothetical protein